MKFDLSIESFTTINVVSDSYKTFNVKEISRVTTFEIQLTL